jgi:hypothetical protein
LDIHRLASRRRPSCIGASIVMASDKIVSPSFSNANASVGDFTDSVAWSAQTEVSASEVVEKQRLVK